MEYRVEGDAFYVKDISELHNYGSFVTEKVGDEYYVHPSLPKSCFSHVVDHKGIHHYQKYSPCSICKNSLKCSMLGEKNTFEVRPGKEFRFPVGFDVYQFCSENKKIHEEK